MASGYLRLSASSNWEAAELTQQQQEYAATDAWVCPRILEALEHSEPKSEPLTIISCRGVAETLQAVDKRYRRRHRGHRYTGGEGHVKQSD